LKRRGGGSSHLGPEQEKVTRGRKEESPEGHDITGKRLPAFWFREGKTKSKAETLTKS